MLRHQARGRAAVLSDPRHWQPEPDPIDPIRPPYGFNTLVAQEAITGIGFYMFEGRPKEPRPHWPARLVSAAPLRQTGQRQRLPFWTPFMREAEDAEVLAVFSRTWELGG
jgi:hypothetical protein